MDKRQHSFVINTLHKAGIKWNLPNLLKNFYRQPIANIILCEKLDAVPMRLWIRQRCNLSFLLYSSLEVLANALKQEKKIRHRNWKEKSTFAIIFRLCDFFSAWKISNNWWRKPFGTNKWTNSKVSV